MSTFYQLITGCIVSSPCECCGGRITKASPAAEKSSDRDSTVLATGQFSFTLPLMSIESFGVTGWSFTLRHLSNFDGQDGLLGPKFSFTQSTYLRSESETPSHDEDIWLVTDENVVEAFEYIEGPPVWYSSVNNNTAAVLTHLDAANEFELRASDGAVTIFHDFDADTPGKIKSITDRYGNQQTVVWTRRNGVDQLDSVTDAYGRTVDYTYYDDTYGYQLKEVEDFLGRKLTFQYDSSDRLVAVVTPSITKAADGNAFAGGTAYVFEYGATSGRIEKIWFPNEVAVYLDETTRVVDIDSLTAATPAVPPRYTVEYWATETFENGYVKKETIGADPDGPGGTYQFAYSESSPPDNLIDPTDVIASQTTVTDRNGNETVYDFNDANMVVHKEVKANRSKLAIGGTTPVTLADSYETWTKYNAHNQPLVVVYPEGNSVEYEYDDGSVSGMPTYSPRIGLLKAVTQKPGNTIDAMRVSGVLDPDVTGGYVRDGDYNTKPCYSKTNSWFIWWYGEMWILSAVKGTPGSTYWYNAHGDIEGDYTPAGATGTATVATYTPSRAGSNGQEELTTLYFYDPLYNQQCAVIEPRGNPIDSTPTDTWFTPQNGGDPPTTGDRSRYATFTYFDYQKDSETTVKGDTVLQEALGLTEDEIEDLIAHVQGEMDDFFPATPVGYRFQMELGDINGDGTGDGTGINAPHLGNVVKVKHPSVRRLVQSEDAWAWNSQTREEVFTVNARGQTTTHTGPEGNTTAYVRYPYNDPEGDGQFVSDVLSTNQYGRMKEVHVDVDPTEVMSLIGEDGDLVDFNQADLNLRKYVSQVLADHPTAYWRLGEATGATIAVDSSGFGQDGTYIDTPELGVRGALFNPDKAVKLDGTSESEYVDCGNDTSLQITGNITLEAWVKVTDFPDSSDYAAIISKGVDGASIGYWLALYNDGVDKLIAGAGVGSPTAVWAIEGWETGQWVHVAARYDGTNWQLYFNGAEVADDSGTGPTSTAKNVFIGAFDVDPDGEYFFDGAIDEVAIYNYALSEDRILAHYNTGVSPSYLDQTTRFQGIPGGVGCSACGYDALGNVLSQTDPRGFTTTFDRNEMGEVYRTTSPAPYNYRTETYYDANRNVIQVDVEDKVVDFTCEDPTSEDYAKYIPTGSGTTAHVPTTAGAGGADRPGWFSSYYTYDLLDNKIEDDIDATGSTPQRLVTTYEYDANQNLTKITKPEDNIVEYDYDERDLQIATRVGYYKVDETVVEPGAVTITIYDSNGNVIDTVGAVDRLDQGENGATVLDVDIADAFDSGSSMDHTGTWVIENTYDGFDRVIKAEDAIANVAEFTHDPDGRVIATTQKGPVGGASPTDRNETGNQVLTSSETRFDEAGRAYEIQQDAFVSSTVNLGASRKVTQNFYGLTANSTSNRTTGFYDMVSSSGVGQGPDSGDNSYVVSRSVFDSSGRLIASATDNAAVTTFEYDGANRQIRINYPQATNYAASPETKDVGYVETEYDANGNVTRTTSTEYSQIVDAPTSPASEAFESYACYDALNRLVVSASQGKDGSLEEDIVESGVWPLTSETIASRFGHDSRSNQTLVIDPKSNTSIAVYDGASRAIESIQHLRAGGAGGTPEGDATFLADGGATVRTDSILDGNGRLAQLVDDRGGTTVYTYDTLDRQIAVTFADGSQRTTDYNAASDVIEYIDENGSESDYEYDAIGRLTKVEVTTAAGITGTTLQTFQYDGLSRMTQCVDTDASAATVDIFYDSLNRTVHETQYFGSARYITHTSFKSLPIIALEYPNGRDVAYNYDELYRLNKTTDTTGSTDIARWSYYGPGRVAELELGEDSGSPVLVCSHLNNARTNSAVQTTESNPAWGDKTTDRLGYDGAGRTITKRYLTYGLEVNKSYSNSDTPKVGFTTAYDFASNKEWERRLVGDTRSHLYPTLDSLNRLRKYERGKLKDTSGVISIDTAITLPGAKTQQTYRLDGLGNWQRTDFTSVITTSTTSDTIQLRRHNSANQVTKFGDTGVKYDASPYGRAIGALDPTAYWRLGEASGTTAFDQTGNHDGTYSGVGSMGQPGALVDDYNTAVLFNSGGPVSVADHADFNFGSAMSAVLWVSGGSASGQTIAAHWDTNGQQSWRMSNSSNKLKVEIEASNGYQKVYTSSVTVFGAGWHMVAFTFESNVLRLFVDGQEDTNVSVGTDDDVNSLRDSTAALTLAAHLVNGSAAESFYGELDEVAVFDSALTVEQINELYRIGQATLAGPAGNGNIVNDGTRRSVYDAFNRVKEVYKESGTPGEFTVKIAEYTYDALGRRIRKVVPEISGGNGGLNGDTPAGTINYFYDGVQCIEERDDLDAPKRQYVWGQYVDELIQQRKIDGETETDYYLLSDLLYRATALTEDDGTIYETYDCDAYGNTIAYDDEGTGGWWSDDETPTNNPKCQFIFTGRRYDPETSNATTQIYFYRARYYSPTLGRFLQRDPFGYADSMSLYEYVKSAPTGYVDPVGGPPLSAKWLASNMWVEFSVSAFDRRNLGGFLGLAKFFGYKDRLLAKFTWRFLVTCGEDGEISVHKRHMKKRRLAGADVKMGFGPDLKSSLGKRYVGITSLAAVSRRGSLKGAVALGLGRAVRGLYTMDWHIRDFLVGAVEDVFDTSTESAEDVVTHAGTAGTVATGFQAVTGGNLLTSAINAAVNASAGLVKGILEGSGLNYILFLQSNWYKCRCNKKGRWKGTWTPVLTSTSQVMIDSTEDLHHKGGRGDMYWQEK